MIAAVSLLTRASYGVPGKRRSWELLAVEALVWINRDFISKELMVALAGVQKEFPG